MAPRAGFEIHRKLLNALVVGRVRRAEYPSDTPRHKPLWQERMRSLWLSSGTISTEEACRVSSMI